ncbi:MAG: hypothetical protein H6822_10905 [Planctomycetaceae bacterium]|nr:hypothetical protein [Planctomycetales bacterium]MCB9922683.1 hypothetical protein [Planctomycetaceae bacterium]
METIYRDYAPKGVRFFYIYKALAHPETNGYVTPFTLDERLLHVKEAERTLGSEIPWICDTMENDLKHGLGDAPNSEFIIDADGRVAVRRSWSNPSELRRDLEKLVGAVDPPTTVAALNMNRVEPRRVANTGVVPRVRIPGQMQALVIQPAPISLEPFYVKLRAEADSDVTKYGKGKLYLGFHLDPIYDVHWNNLAAPLTFEIKASEGTMISPSSGAAPKVEVESDADPREFLLDIDAADGAESFEMTVKYFACNDAEGWCKPVTQQYTVALEVDRDGGSARRGGQTSPRDDRPMRRPVPARFSAGRVMGMVSSVDVSSRIVAIRTREGREQSIVVPDDAVLRRDDHPGQLSELKRRNRIMVELDANRKDDQGRPYAKRLMSRSD